jgi:hypothetical protein
MPFDGSDFHSKTFGSSAPGIGSPGIWDKVRSLTLGFLARGPSRSDPSADMLTVQLLTTARSLIEDEQNWVQHDYETRDGRFCAVGALRYAARFVGPPGALSSANRALLSVARERGFSKIEKMNDRSSHARVLTAFDEAISRVRG